MIKLLFLGDYCSNKPEDIVLSNDFITLLESSDLRCVNFEAPLEAGIIVSPNGRSLNQSNESPSWIEKNKFDIVSIANNHMYDYGEPGILKTKSFFNKSLVIGAGNWDEVYSVSIIEIRGTKIGFISGTSADFSSLKDQWTDKDKIGCAWINHPNINNIITAAKDECDFLIVLSHGGIEFMDVPLPEWRDRYRELIDMGADAIIGSHPHVPQGVESYQNKPIFYSLGNFIFDKERQNLPMYWNNGLAAIIEIDNNKISYKSIPIVNDNNNIYIDNSTSIKKHLEYINDILYDDGLYIQKVNSDVLHLYNKYKGWLISGLGSVELSFELKKIARLIIKLFSNRNAEKVALHQIRDESTRWLMSRAIKLKTNTNL